MSGLDRARLGGPFMRTRALTCTAALIAALALGVAAARGCDMPRHRAWMIRAYAIGMGQGTVALVMFPLYLVTGEPPTGLTTDIVVVSMWLLNIALGEWVIRRMSSPRPLQPI